VLALVEMILDSDTAMSQRNRDFFITLRDVIGREVMLPFSNVQGLSGWEFIN
jgi:hypothetical protein